MKPSIGRIVLFTGEKSNGLNTHPAIITRVWSDVCVNLQVFLDAGVVIVKTSVMQDESGKAEHSWMWPPRV